jgi:hypothetical protein
MYIQILLEGAFAQIFSGEKENKTVSLLNLEENKKFENFNLTFGIKIQKPCISKPFKRYWSDIWKKNFDLILNNPLNEKIDFNKIISILESYFKDNEKKLKILKTMLLKQEIYY